jgi:Flp pilus assembly pilin Flp
MMKLLKALRQDEYGVILSTEIVIIGSLLVIGLITGLTCLQKSVNGELQDLAGAVGALDQTYSFSAHRKSGYGGQCCAYTAGSAFNNCERDDRCSSDIIGCEATCVSQARSCGNCGNCGSCNHRAGGPECGSVCGTCGGQAGGCSSCGSALMNGGGPRCIDTGVPKMKVTEWPSSDCPVESEIHSHFGPIHESELIEQSVPIMEHQFGLPEQPGSPVQPIESFEALPMPVPEGQPVPPVPVPAMTYLPRGRAQFVFPEYVW